MDLLHQIVDISLHIFNYLPINDIHSLGLVNRDLNKGYTNELQWKDQCERDYCDDYYGVANVNNYEKYKWCYIIGKFKTSFNCKCPNNIIYNQPKMELCYQNMKFLPKEIGIFVNLKTLYLNDNQLTFLPAEIGLLVNLVALEVSNNLLKCLPVEMSSLHKLQRLYLKHNKIELFPVELKSLVSLNIVYIDDNLRVQVTQIWPKALIY